MKDMPRQVTRCDHVLCGDAVPRFKKWTDKTKTTQNANTSTEDYAEIARDAGHSPLLSRENGQSPPPNESFLTVLQKKETVSHSTTILSTTHTHTETHRHRQRPQLLQYTRSATWRATRFSALWKSRWYELPLGLWTLSHFLHENCFFPLELPPVLSALWSCPELYDTQ